MRILHTESSLGWGGQEIRILSEAKGLIGRGHEIFLACPPESCIHTAAADYGVPVVSLPIRKKRLFDLLALRRWLKSAGHIDVINTHSSTDSWLVALACATLHAPPPVVRTRHISSPIPDNSATRWLYGRSASFVVATGEALRQQISSSINVSPERIFSVPTGIDSKLFFPGDRQLARRKVGLPDNRFIFGIVATLRFQKGHAELLEALARQDDSSCMLAIIGDGPQKENILQMITRLGLGQRVLLAGNQKEVSVWYQALDAFVLPTHAEGMPQSLMQAMLSGLPVITTPVGSIPQYISNERDCLLVPPKSISRLTEAMQWIRSDANLREHLGLAARNTALAHFDIEHMLDKMEAIFVRASAPRNTPS